MQKEELIALWNAKDWDNTSTGLYFISQRGTCELNFNFTNYSENDVFAMPNNFMQRLSAELKRLDQLAHEVIQGECPDDDATELVLTDLMFDKSGCYGAFALGYDLGESPAGQHYLLVKFDEQFQPNPELIYETY